VAGTGTIPDDDLKGNEADGRDLAQSHYDQEFNHRAKAEELADLEASYNTPYTGKNGQRVDSHGDVVQSNYNADADLKSQEENQAPVQRGGGRQQGKAKVGAGSNWRSKFLAGTKRYGASGGAMVLLGGGFFGASIVMVPGSLLVSIEKASDNDSADATRTNISFKRAYVARLFKSQGGKSGSKIEDKLTKMTDAQKQRWNAEGFDMQVDADGKITSAEFPDGTKVDNAEAFTDHAENTPTGRDAVANVEDTRSAFFDNQRMADLLDRFGIRKSDRIAGSTAETEEERNKAVDEATDANDKIGETPGETEDARAKGITEKTIGEDGSKIKSRVDEIAGDSKDLFDKLGKAGIAGAPISAACAVYNAAKLTNTVIKTEWIYDLVSFAYPFVRAAAQIESQGDIEPEVVNELANRLTWYNTDQNAPDYNKTAMDSQGLQMAIYGDLSGLTKFSEQYTSWGWEVAVDSFANSYVKTAENFLGGKDNVKDTCTGAHIVQSAATFACLAGPQDILACIALMAAGELAKQLLMPLLIEQLAQPAIDFLAKVDLSSALKGEGAGDAIAAGIGLLLSGQTMNSGLIPAGGSQALPNIRKFIADTNDTYNTYTTQLAVDDAKKHPFDVSNQYSFMGQLASMINPYLNGDGTLYSKFANLTGTIGSSFARLPTTANALFSQPSNMTSLDGISNDPAGNRIAKCKDPDMADIGAVCDWSGRIVGYTSDNVLQGLDAVATGSATAGSDILSQSINYMLNDPYDNPRTHQTVHGDIDPNTGDTIPDSQFKLYVDNCINRSNGKDGGFYPIGSSTASLTDPFYDWTTGEKCMPTDPSAKADANNHKSDPKMLDAFATYYNWCYVQYATAERMTDCVHDQPENGSSTKPSDCGDGTTGSIYTCALQFDPYGYRMGAGHPEYGTTKWYQSFKANPPTPGTIQFDCSSLVMAALVAAFGQDVPNQIAPSTFAGDSAHWQSVPKDQAKQGDVVVFSEHVEIIQSNDPGSQHFTTFGAHTDDTDLPDQISSSGYSYGAVDVGTFRYVGPGVGKGTGNINV